MNALWRHRPCLNIHEVARLTGDQETTVRQLRADWRLQGPEGRHDLGWPSSVERVYGESEIPLPKRLPAAQGRILQALKEAG